MVYKASSKGLADIAKSAQTSAACVAVAQQIASKANGLDPAGDYKAEAATVLSGTKNEPRSGARVVQTRPSRARNKALRQALK